MSFNTKIHNLIVSEKFILISPPKKCIPPYKNTSRDKSHAINRTFFDDVIVVRRASVYSILGHWTWESRSREAGRFSLLIYGFEQLRYKHTSPFSNRVSVLAERYNLLDVNLKANRLILARGARPRE